MKQIHSRCLDICIPSQKGFLLSEFALVSDGYVRMVSVSQSIDVFDNIEICQNIHMLLKDFLKIARSSIWTHRNWYSKYQIQGVYDWFLNKHLFLIIYYLYYMCSDKIYKWYICNYWICEKWYERGWTISQPRVYFNSNQYGFGFTIDDTFTTWNPTTNTLTLSLKLEHRYLSCLTYYTNLKNSKSNRFGKHICELLRKGSEEGRNQLSNNYITNKMTIHLNILCALMKHQVTSDENC